MKNRVRMKIVVWLSMACMLTSMGISHAEESPDSLKPAATDAAKETVRQAIDEEDSDSLLYIENEGFLLSINKENGNLYIVDKRSNQLWESNPANASEDEVASGINRTNLRSQLLVDFEENGSSVSSMNSAVGCFSRGEVQITEIKTGFRVVYKFTEEGFTIPVEYHLTAKGFETEVLLSQMKEEGENKLYSLSVLPFFGTGTSKENGYLFIPDGSGTLIYFNNGKERLPNYSKGVYGGDATLEDTNTNAGEKNILLPVYGIKKEKGACLTILESGAANCTISAYPSGNINSYNSINSSFCYRAHGMRTLLGDTKSSRTVLFSALDAADIDTYRMQHILLTGADAGYVGMAGAYRDYLQKQGVKRKTGSNSQLFIELYGAAEKDKSFLGFHYNGVELLTTFKQAKTILQALKKRGVQHITTSYKAFSANEIAGKPACFPVPMGQLGSRQQYESLRKYAQESGISVYPYADWIRFSKSGKGFSAYSDVSLGLELSAFQVFPYRISTGTPSKSEKPSYYLRPDRYTDAVRKMIATLKKYPSSGVLLDNAVQVISSDYSKNGFQRDRTQNILTEQYKKLQSQCGLLMSAPNAYAIPYAAGITDLPMTSSRYLVFDEDIPFLQIVLHGLIDYSGESVNIGGQSENTLLKHIETGSNVKYSFIYREGSALLETNLDYLYAAHYANNLEQAASWYSETAKLAEATKDSGIVDHQVTGEVVTVTYSNGTKVYVNYAGTSGTVDGVAVGAKNYVIVAKGNGK